MTTSTDTRTAQLDTRELAAWRGMLRAYRELVGSLDAELVREHNLPLSSYEVLISLADAPENRLRMGQLANELLLSRSGLTRLVDRLERQGLVERTRCPDDARGWHAVLTDKGREKLKAARPAHLEGVRRHFLDHLSDEELDALAEVWKKVTPA